MSDKNVAWMQTPRTTHLVLWIEDTGFRTAAGRVGYTTEVVTLCGRKKNHLKTARVLYDTPAGKPFCKVCQVILTEAVSLVPDDVRI